jgi:HAD superfamily hydrolase (TIGR01484 family)
MPERHPHPVPPCLPWSSCAVSSLLDVHGVLTDIDDTLTRDGAIEPVALDALQRARAAGLPVIAVTGRPMGWSQPFAATWPLDAIVAENGAVMLRREASSPDGVRVDYLEDSATRARNAERLQACAQRILRTLPQARLATDSSGRVTDIAVDHAEHTHLPAQDIERVVQMMRDDGLTATVSSIHINGWLGKHDKWHGACWAVQSLFGRDLAAEQQRWVYVGDSTNDQALFARLALSVGVANLLTFAAQLSTWPRYLAQAERGAGFAEVVSAVLAARAMADSRPPGA